MSIITKVGDGGDTSLGGGRKVRKNDPLVEALGAVDELNAALGLAATLPAGEPLVETLSDIQRRLCSLSADLAARPGRGAPTPRISPADAAWVEKEAAALETSLPPLKNFILPGGAPAGAALHWARAVCRRAERRIVPLLKKERASKDALIFLNRVSDFLFLIARDANRRAGKPESLWP
jgi:cob(I)alamin adenosyltransferase